jgi:hypothetical protein
MKRLFITLLVGFSIALSAQVNVRDSANAAWHFKMNFAGYAPGGDLADRFGPMVGIGLDIGYKTRENWLFGVSGNFMFGNKVNDTYYIFGSQTTAEGYFLGINGEYAIVEFINRGFYTGGYFGKILPILNHNPNSGLFFTLGLGYIQNKIYIRNPSETYPQLLGEYGKGYDRLHSGCASVQNIGYLHSGNKRTINFAVAFEFMQGFTSNQRAFNWDTNMPDTARKIDLYFGLKVSWFLPIYDKNQQKFYYY